MGGCNVGRGLFRGAFPQESERRTVRNVCPRPEIIDLAGHDVWPSETVINEMIYRDQEITVVLNGGDRSRLFQPHNWRFEIV